MTLQFYIIYIIILLAGNASARFEVKVVNQENVQGMRSESLSLKWMFNGIPQNYDVFSSNLHFNVTTPALEAKICEWNSISKTPLVTQIGKSKFGDRINVSFTGNTYNFTITDLQYKDAGPYLLQAGVAPGGDLQFLQISSSTIIISKITGGPEFCNGDLQASYNFSSNVDQVIRITLCGVPTPDLEWRLHDGAFMPANRTTINSYTYKYFIKLPPLTQRICGRKLVFNVSGKRAFEIGRPVFLTNFKPDPVRNIQFFPDVTSKYIHCVKWELLDTECEVEYNIQFLDSKKASLGSVTIMGNDSFCTNNFTNASSVIMLAVFNGTKGDNSEPIFRKTTTTATTTTTTTTITTPTEGTKKVDEVGKPSSSSTTIIIIVVIVVLVLFGVAVVVIIIIKKKMKGGNVKSKKSEDDVVELKPPSYTDEGDYASVDAMQKKAADDKNPDQMLYAELGAGGGRKGPKSEPMESNYAQVKVDEMGYPARGPASDMSEPPQYPTSINRDRSRRHSPPPHYGGLDDDDGVIV